jgi:hypothetical protein
MFSPPSLSDSVKNITFLILPIKDLSMPSSSPSKQLTIVQIYYEPHDPTNTFDFCTNLPNTIEDASTRLLKQYPSIISDSMLAWLPKPCSTNNTQKDPPFILPSSLTPLDYDDENTLTLLGCSHVVRIIDNVHPNQNKKTRSITSAWFSDITPQNTLFIPTLNLSLPSWRAKIIVVPKNTISHGICPQNPINVYLRWDLLNSKCGIMIDADMSCARLIFNRSESVPFYNIYLKLDSSEYDPASRFHFGISGVRLLDNTVGRRVAFFNVGFQSIPVICGCFLRDSINFPSTHIPWFPTEIMSRPSPITFSDDPINPLIVNISYYDHAKKQQNVLKVDPSLRFEHGDAIWSSFI